MIESSWGPKHTVCFAWWLLGRMTSLCILPVGFWAWFWWSGNTKWPELRVYIQPSKEDFICVCFSSHSKHNTCLEPVVCSFFSLAAPRTIQAVWLMTTNLCREFLWRDIVTNYQEEIYPLLRTQKETNFTMESLAVDGLFSNHFSKGIKPFKYPGVFQWSQFKLPAPQGPQPSPLIFVWALNPNSLFARKSTLLPPPKIAGPSALTFSSLYF